MSTGPHVVQVWLIDVRRCVPVVADLSAVLDDDERRRADRLLSAEDRRRFVVMRGAVRCILAEHVGGVPERIRWRYGPHGKPGLSRAGAGPQVSLSRSGNLGLLAVTDRRTVGVDVQESPPHGRAVRLAARYFPVAESGFVAAGAPHERARRFTQLWVRKEACVKAAGARLVQGLPIPVLGDDDGALVTCLGKDFLVRDLAVALRYRAAVALGGTAGFEVTYRSWTP